MESRLQIELAYFNSSSILESSKQRRKRLQQEVSHSNSKRISRIESVIPCFVLTALPLSFSIRNSSQNSIVYLVQNRRRRASLPPVFPHVALKRARCCSGFPTPFNILHFGAVQYTPSLGYGTISNSLGPLSSLFVGNPCQCMFDLGGYQFWNFFSRHPRQSTSLRDGSLVFVEIMCQPWQKQLPEQAWAPAQMKGFSHLEVSGTPPDLCHQPFY